MGLLRGKLKWTIPGAGTAYSVLHFLNTSGSTPTQAEADDVVVRMRAFADAWKANLPNVVKIDVVPEVEEINKGSGALIGAFPVTPGAQIAGGAASTSGWSAPSGAVISWSTAGVRNGRRVRGRTFIVPLSNECYDVDGTIKATELTRLNTGATALRTGSSLVEFCVWARPTAPGATDGEDWAVLSHRVPDMAAILTSRRS